MIEKIQIKDTTLYLGDCREVMPTLGKIAAVVTDPPYGIGIASNPVRQMHERKEWDAVPPTDEEINRLLAISNHQIIWGGNYFDLPPNQCFLVWDKKQPENFSRLLADLHHEIDPGCGKSFWHSVSVPRRLILADEIHRGSGPFAGGPGHGRYPEDVS